MKTGKRTFTPEGRLSILQEGEREGQTQTYRKYRDWYNNRRRHTTLGMTPAMKWAEKSTVAVLEAV